MVWAAAPAGRPCGGSAPLPGAARCLQAAALEKLLLVTSTVPAEADPPPRPSLGSLGPVNLNPPSPYMAAPPSGAGAQQGGQQQLANGPAGAGAEGRDGAAGNQVFRMFVQQPQPAGSGGEEDLAAGAAAGGDGGITEEDAAEVSWVEAFPVPPWVSCSAALAGAVLLQLLKVRALAPRHRICESMLPYAGGTGQAVCGGGAQNGARPRGRGAAGSSDGCGRGCRSHCRWQPSSERCGAGSCGSRASPGARRWWGGSRG